MSEAKRLINRAIDFIVQGEPQGAEIVLERALDEVDKLVDALKQLQWKSMESAPKETPIIVTDGKLQCVVKITDVCGGNWIDPVGVYGHHLDLDFDYYDIIGWMPLQEIPTNETLSNLRAAGLAEGE